jgi:hypothetical protein
MLFSIFTYFRLKYFYLFLTILTTTVVFVVFKWTDHFVESGRIFEGVSDVCQVSSFLILFGSNVRKTIHQVLDVRAEMLDGLKTVGEIPEKKFTRFVNAGKFVYTANTMQT